MSEIDGVIVSLERCRPSLRFLSSGILDGRLRPSHHPCERLRLVLGRFHRLERALETSYEALTELTCECDSPSIGRPRSMILLKVAETVHSSYTLEV